MFDALRGRAPPPPPPTLESDLGPSSSPNPTADLDAGAAAVAATANAPPGVLTASGERLYNPYDGLAAAVDGRGLRGTYRLPAQPEFLFAEEAAVHRRSWSENLTYYTGAGYLVGAALGGSRGAAAALRGAPAAAAAAAPAGAGGGAASAAPPPPASTRLLVNRVLNSGGRAGRGAANALGALGLFFAVAESGLDAAADGRGPDAAPTIGAGFVTGALFRSPRGPRAAGVAGAVGAAAAAGLVAARRFVSSDL